MRASSLLSSLLLVIVTLAGCAQSVPPQSEAETLVEQSRLTIESLKDRARSPGQTFRANLADARGVLIFPNVFKAAVGIGGQGGSGVLLARNADGEWSYPAFYNMGGGSAGFQLGAVSAQMVFILRSDAAVKSVLDNQFQLGGDAQWTIGNIGAGYTAATTTNIGADVVGFAIADGVFAGFSLQGGGIARRADLNAAFYGKGATPRAIVIDRKFWNVQADPLRKSLVVD
jgi:lipid-binding SYLF domain-containing protein